MWPLAGPLATPGGTDVVMASKMGAWTCPPSGTAPSSGASVVAARLLR